MNRIIKVILMAGIFLLSTLSCTGKLNEDDIASLQKSYYGTLQQVDPITGQAVCDAVGAFLPIKDFIGTAATISFPALGVAGIEGLFSLPGFDVTGIEFEKVSRHRISFYHGGGVQVPETEGITLAGITGYVEEGELHMSWKISLEPEWNGQKEITFRFNIAPEPAGLRYVGSLSVGSSNVIENYVVTIHGFNEDRTSCTIHLPEFTMKAMGKDKTMPVFSVGGVIVEESNDGASVYEYPDAFEMTGDGMTIRFPDGLHGSIKNGQASFNYSLQPKGMPFALKCHFEGISAE